MRALVYKNKSVPRQEALGYVHVVALFENDLLVSATEENIPTYKEIFIYSGYKEFIDQKYQNNELFFVDFEEVPSTQDKENNCLYGANAQTAKPVGIKDLVTTIINTNQELDPNEDLVLIQDLNH